MKRTRLLLILDTVLFLMLALLFQPRVGGLTLHEWLGFAVIPPIVVHVLCEWRWIVATAARLRERGAWRRRIDFFLIVLLFVAFTVTAFSGAMTSFVALPALGVAAGNFENWRRLHNTWQIYLLVLMAMHLAINWNWVLGAVRRHVLRRPTVREDASPPESGHRES